MGIRSIEDQLIDAVERMGYGLNINELRGYVKVNTGSGKKRDDHRFDNIASALDWVERQERKIREFGR